MSWPLCMDSQQNLGRIRCEGHSCLIRASSQPHYPNFQGRKCEAVAGVPLESTLLLYDPHSLSLRFIAVYHQIVPSKNSLLFTEIRLGMKLWLSFFFPAKFPLVLHAFQVLGHFPAEFSVSWSRAGPLCHPFRPKRAFYSLVTAGPFSFCCFLLNKESEQSS